MHGVPPDPKDKSSYCELLRPGKDPQGAQGSEQWPKCLTKAL